MSNKNELYINGMTNKVDTINSIIDNIDNNDLDTAKDSLNPLSAMWMKKGNTFAGPSNRPRMNSFDH